MPIRREYPTCSPVGAAIPKATGGDVGGVRAHKNAESGPRSFAFSLSVAFGLTHPLSDSSQHSTHGKYPDAGCSERSEHVRADRRQGPAKLRFTQEIDNFRRKCRKRREAAEEPGNHEQPSLRRKLGQPPA